MRLYHMSTTTRRPPVRGEDERDVQHAQGACAASDPPTKHKPVQELPPLQPDRVASSTHFSQTKLSCVQHVCKLPALQHMWVPLAWIQRPQAAEHWRNMHGRFAPAQVKMSMTSSMRQNARAASDTPTKHEQATDTGLCSSALR